MAGLSTRPVGSFLLRCYRRVRHEIILRFHLAAPLRTADRSILERIILPEIARRSRDRPVLFVGCQLYTRHYRRFFRGSTYWTMDSDPNCRRYGAAHHVIDSVEHIRRHFPANHFDAILLNGVIGWGLNELGGVETAMDGCFECLAPGGLLLIGWNDTPEHRPFPIGELPGIKRYSPCTLPGLGTSEYRVAGPERHVFSLYEKPAS